MMPVFVRESLQPPRSHSVKDVAVEEPFEEAKEQVHRQKRRDERGHASGELARPQLGKERMIAGKQKHELKKGEKRKAQDGKATPMAMCHGARVRRTVVSSGASAAQPAPASDEASVAISRAQRNRNTPPPDYFLNKSLASKLSPSVRCAKVSRSSSGSRRSTSSSSGNSEGAR